MHVVTLETVARVVSVMDVSLSLTLSLSRTRTHTYASTKRDGYFIKSAFLIYYLTIISKLSAALSVKKQQKLAMSLSQNSNKVVFLCLLLKISIGFT